MKYERLDRRRRRNKAPRKGTRQELGNTCDYVAAKFQRMIDKIKIKKEDNN